MADRRRDLAAAIIYVVVTIIGVGLGARGVNDKDILAANRKSQQEFELGTFLALAIVVSVFGVCLRRKWPIFLSMGILMHLGTRGKGVAWSHMAVLRHESSESTDSAFLLAGGVVCWLAAMLGLVYCTVITTPKGWLRPQSGLVNPALGNICLRFLQGWLLNIIGAALVMHHTDFESAEPFLLPFDTCTAGLLLCFYTGLSVLVLTSPAWAAVLALQANNGWFALEGLFSDSSKLPGTLKAGTALVFVGNMSLLIVLINEFVPPFEQTWSLDVAEKGQGHGLAELIKRHPHCQFMMMRPTVSAQALVLENVDKERVRSVLVGMASLPFVAFQSLCRNSKYSRLQTN